MKATMKAVEIERSTKQVEEAKAEEAKAVESYELSVEELLTMQLLTTRRENARLSLALAEQHSEAYNNSLAGKYSAFGKYELLGEVDTKTRRGTRRLA